MATLHLLAGPDQGKQDSPIYLNLKKTRKCYHRNNDYTIFDMYSSPISAFKVFMSDKSESSKGWLLLEHKKSVNDLNVTEPEWTRNKKN